MRTRTRRRPPSMLSAVSASSSRTGSPSISASVNRVTLNGSFRSGVIVLHSVRARSVTPERSLPWMTAARTPASGAFRKRSTSGRRDRIMRPPSTPRQDAHHVQADQSGQIGGGAVLPVLLGGDGGVGLVGGGVGDRRGLRALEGFAACDGGQGPGGPDCQFIAAGRVVDAAAQRAALVLDLGRQAIERRLGAVAAEGVLQLFAQAIAQPVVGRRYGDARQGAADPRFAIDRTSTR